MEWSKDPYKLDDGTVEEGSMAAALRSLDAFDPTSPERRAAPTGEGLKEEAVNFLDGVRWCADLGKLVVRSWPDMHALKDGGYLHDLLGVLLSARVVWSARELTRHPDEPRVKAYAKAAAEADKRGVGRDLLASVKERLRIGVGELDALPDVIGTPSGVFSLKDGELLCEAEMLEASLSGRPVEEFEGAALMVTKSTRASFESPMARLEFGYDERWDAFVDEICDGDGEKASFLQRALGYSLPGGNPEKATFVLWGPRRDNGKSTLMSIVKHVMGDYAGSMKPGEILVNKRENPQAANPGIAKLAGKRLVDVSEPPLGAELNGALIKQMASGIDEISARHLKCDEFSFAPQFTLWMHCNALPVVRDPSAIDPQHMFVIEFTRSFTGAERDLTLADRFKTPDGMHTVLVWLLRGYHDYLERGLDAPACVTEATTNWLTISKSWLQAFLEQRCVVESSRTCGVTEFKEAAKAFCEAQGETFTLRGMKAVLKGANIVESKSGSTRFYKGVGLLPSGDKNESKVVPDLSQLGQNDSEGKSTVILT